MSDHTTIPAQLIGEGRFTEAEALLDEALADDPQNGFLWQLKGQCCNFQNRMREALKCHLKADSLTPGNPYIILALGIAQQKLGMLHDSRETLVRAHRIDPEHWAVLNSLGITFKLLGDLDAADKAYRRGLDAHARHIVASFQNHPSNPVFEHDELPCHLWEEHALTGAIWLAKTIGASKIALPDSEFAELEARSNSHGGLLWKEIETDGEKVFFIFPNFINTFRESLYRDNAYFNLIGNRGTVLELTGKMQDARDHFREAQYFADRQQE